MYGTTDSIDADISVNHPRIINLTDRSIEESFELAKCCQIIRVKVRTKTGQIVHEIQKKAFEVLFLRPIYATLFVIKRGISIVLGHIGEMIENFWGPSFARPYSDEQIYKMAWVYPRNTKTTLQAIIDYYDFLELSRRQAGHIKKEILDNFPHRFTHEEA